jgi:hypothetical protein
VDVPHLVYPLSVGSLGCVSYLAILNNDTMNIYVQIFGQIKVFISFESMPRSGIVGSYSDIHLNGLKNFQTVFYINVYEGSTYSKFVIVRAFDSFHPSGMKCYLIMVLICIFLLTTNVEDLFMCLLTMCIFSMKKIQILCPFKNLD